MLSPIKATTQEHLDILDITNNLILLKDGSASMVIKLKAVNFDLLSFDEQEATIYAYASLLNSLSFSVQILIRSEKKDISNYLKSINNQLNAAVNPVIKDRLMKYQKFIEKTVKERNVLDKKFYIIVPFSRLELGLSNSMNPLAKTDSLPYDKAYIIQKALNSLEPKRDHLLRQFAHLNLNPRPLNTQELIQLFYEIYNPDATQTTQIATSKQYETPIVQKR